MNTRNYIELVRFETFEERLEYLKLHGKVGEDTFGFDRYLNQMLYHSGEWKSFKKEIIVRDLGHDLAMISDDYEINGPITVHHIIPITVKDVINMNPIIFDPNNVVCVSARTHKAIHYGIDSVIPKTIIQRKPGDTLLW